MDANKVDVYVDVVEHNRPAASPLVVYDLASLQRTFVRAVWLSIALMLVIGILVPMPMFAAQYIFSRRFFEVWIG